MQVEVPCLLTDAQLAAALGAASDAGSEQSPERRQTRQSRRPPRSVPADFHLRVHLIANQDAARCCALTAQFKHTHNLEWIGLLSFAPCQ